MDVHRKFKPVDNPHDAYPVEAAVAMNLHDELLATKPESARHDSDICPFCVEKASQSTASPSGVAGSDVSDKHAKSTKGGANPTMTDISQETHEALLQKAVADAVKTTEQALSTKTDELTTTSTKAADLEKANADLQTDNDRINKELDAAQVKLTSATEEVASLKADMAKKDEASQLNEIASKRSEQVKNLKLFPDEYVSEKASKWAALDEAGWTDQLEEWKQLKPAVVSEGDSKTQDAASAMTGTSDDLTKEKQQDAASETKPSARRAALGLV